MKNKNQDTSLSQRETHRLKESILKSVQQVNDDRRNRKLFFAAAASFVLLLGVGYLSQLQSESSLDDFMKSVSNIDIGEETEVILLLGDQAKVDLNEENPFIQYSPSGQSVTFGSGKKLTQQASIKDKVVFNMVLVPYGKRMMLELSDGTVVWLNSGSKLFYPAGFSGDTREVHLEGEAIFDVAHNVEMPFKVSSPHQEIEVLGTVFNVLDYPQDQIMQTILKSGSVNITYQEGGTNVKLTPGNLSSFNLESLEIKKEEVDINHYFSWKSGFLSLENTTFSEILTKLSRSYNFEYSIQSEEVANQRLSGKLELKKNIEGILDVLTDVTEFEFEIIDTKIIIKQKAAYD